MNDYLTFAKYVTAEMARNGYPIHCAARGDVDEATLAAYKAELDAAAHERPLQRFLQINPGMLPQQLGAGCRWILPHPDLGGKFEPDFLAARLDSGGVQWTLVELESPTATLFTKDGLPRKQLRKGLSQIQVWRNWVAANRDTARRSKAEHGLGLIGLDHMANGVVIIGRRFDRTDLDRERLQPLMYRERVLIRSYDWLIDEARRRMRFREDLEKTQSVACIECAMPGRHFD